MLELNLSKGNTIGVVNLCFLHIMLDCHCLFAEQSRYIKSRFYNNDHMPLAEVKLQYASEQMIFSFRDISGYFFVSAEGTMSAIASECAGTQ